MDFNTLLTKLVDSLVWPCIFGLVAWRYKNDITQLLRQLTSLKLGGVELQLEFARATGEAAKLPVVPSEGELTFSENDAWTQRMSLANEIVEEAPAAAIITAWKIVEHEFECFQSGTARVNHGDATEFGIPGSIQGLFSRLKAIRDRVNDSGRFISSDDARRFLTLSRRLIVAKAALEDPEHRTWPTQFKDDNELMKFLTENSGAIQSALIPVIEPLVAANVSGEQRTYAGVGIVFRTINGRNMAAGWDVAERFINDEEFRVMRIPIKFWKV